MTPGRRSASDRIFKYGDIDTRGASGSDRLSILNAEERSALSQIKSNGEGTIRSAYTGYQGALLKYKRRRDRREAKNNVNATRLAFAEAWRNLGVQERYPRVTLSLIIKALIYLFMASFDFYVFAQALALVDDVADFSFFWFVGGALGLIVFVSGFFLAHQVKELVVGNAQRNLVAEFREEDPDFKAAYSVRGVDRVLPYSKADTLTLVLSSGVFVILVILAIVIRWNANSGDWASVFLTGMVPVVIVVTELYLNDPLYRLSKKPGFWERHLEGVARKKRISLENVIASYDGFVAQTQAGYNHQRQIARVTAADLGIEVKESVDEEFQSTQSNEWKISVDDLLQEKVSGSKFNDDLLGDGGVTSSEHNSR